MQPSVIPLLEWARALGPLRPPGLLNIHISMEILQRTLHPTSRNRWVACSGCQDGSHLLHGLLVSLLAISCLFQCPVLKKSLPQRTTTLIAGLLQCEFMQSHDGVAGRPFLDVMS